MSVISASGVIDLSGSIIIERLIITSQYQWLGKAMMNRKYKMFILSVLLGLSACGESDSNTTQNIPTEPLTVTTSISEGWKYVDTPYIEFSRYNFTGSIHVGLGAVDDKVNHWLTGLGDTPPQDTNADGRINLNDAPPELINTLFDGREIPVDTEAPAEDIIAVLATNPDGIGAGPARPDIFSEGVYSVFDLLRYTVATRDDLQFDEGSIVSFKNSEFDTFEFKISWDINGDGDFTNDGRYSGSDSWHHRHHGDRGNTDKDYGGQSIGFASNLRMDHHWLRPGMMVRFINYSDTYKNRLKWIWKQEQDRLKANNGKFIIPKVIYKELAPGEPVPTGMIPDHVLAENLEVKAFNMRPDIWQEGQINAIDVYLTLAEEFGYDFSLSYWSTFNSGAVVESFALNKDPIIGQYSGWSGSFPTMGEQEAAYDHVIGIPPCNFGLDGTPEGEGRLTKEECISEYFAWGNLGGNEISEVIGSIGLSYPPEYIGMWGKMSYNAWVGVLDVDLKNNPELKTNVYITDDMLQLADLPLAWDGQGKLNGVLTRKYAAAEPVGNASILNETHFGWKIADCTQCHNEEKNPLGHGGYSWPVNSAEGFDFIQPYYCSTCHGANGAPDQHDFAAKCFACHNKNSKIKMKNHHEASLTRIIQPEDLIANKRTTWNQPSNRFVKPEKYGAIEEDYNNDYSLSRTFPDPYSCVACHKTN